MQRGASPSPGTWLGWPRREAGEARREQNLLLRCPGWLHELMGYWHCPGANVPKISFSWPLLLFKVLTQKWICLWFLFHWRILKKMKHIFAFIWFFFSPSQCCFHFRCRVQLWHNPARNNIGDYTIFISLCIFITELFQYQLSCFIHLTSSLHFIA